MHCPSHQFGDDNVWHDDCHEAVSHWRCEHRVGFYSSLQFGCWAVVSVVAYVTKDFVN